MRRLTYSDWKKLGMDLYGPDSKSWEFTCPRCGNRQSIHSVIQHHKNLEDPSKWIWNACEGRRSKGHGCNWSLGGLHQIHKLEVRFSQDGQWGWVPVFEFADDPASSTVEDTTRVQASLLPTDSTSLLAKPLYIFGERLVNNPVNNCGEAVIGPKMLVRVSVGKDGKYYAYFHFNGLVVMWRSSPRSTEAILQLEDAIRSMKENLPQ